MQVMNKQVQIIFTKNKQKPDFSIKKKKTKKKHWGDSVNPQVNPQNGFQKKNEQNIFPDKSLKYF